MPTPTHNAFPGRRRLACPALLAALFLAVPATAAAQVQNGLVAFSGERGAERVIYARNADGTGLRVVPTGGFSDHPAFSPRGQRLAFARYGPLGAQVFTAYLDGTGLRQLTTGPGDSMPAWAPGGEKLVFARGAGDRRDLYTIVADGTGQRRLTLSAADDHSPAWSVNDRIAFVRRTRKRDHIWVMAGAGGLARRLTGGKLPDQGPAWSPTGRTLVFSRGRAGKRDLYLVTADGRRTRRLTRVPGEESDAAFSPDGSRVVFSHRRAGKRRMYLIKVRGKAAKRLPARSLRVRRLTTSRSASRYPSWQPAGLDPVVAAAGDIACGPENERFNGGEGVPGSCRQRLTSEQLFRLDLSSILAVGDIQYEDGTLSEFLQSFNRSWGRLKALIRPVPGNHEYNTPGAAGYFDYFNGVGRQSGPAGDRNAGYYSFDLGKWHLIALNSECAQIGGCGAGSPQMQWLRTDLAAHPVTCTLAYWHRPTFTSGDFSDEGDMVPAWEALYAADADLILAAHEHFYERFAPQSPSGASDPARGIRQLTVGMGGKSRFGFPPETDNSELLDNATIGILQLTLREGAYDWRLRGAPTGRVADSGTGACH